MKVKNESVDKLIVTRDEVLDEINKLDGLEEKFGSFWVPDSSYWRFDKSDFANALKYIVESELLELYRESMKVYDDNGIYRPRYTQRALPTINEGVPIILSFEEPQVFHTDLVIKTNPVKNSKVVLSSRSVPNMWPQKIEYK